MNRLIYDGRMDREDTVDYYFVSENMASATKLFEELYEEDIIEYAAERVTLEMEEDGYEVTGCSVCITVNKDTDEIESVTITATAETDSEIIDLEPADIELEEEQLQILLGKVKAE